MAIKFTIISLVIHLGILATLLITLSRKENKILVNAIEPIYVQINEASNTKSGNKENKPITAPIDNSHAKEPADEHSKEVSEQSEQNEYIFSIRKKILAQRKYPLLAKKQNQEGIVVIGFRILKDGSIDRIHILQKSEFDSLNEATLDLLKNLKNVDPIPDKMKKSEWSLSISIIYQIH